MDLDRNVKLLYDELCNQGTSGRRSDSFSSVGTPIRNGGKCNMSIRCIHCNGRGWLLFHGKEIPCSDCKQIGFHKHCLACKGRGVLWLGGGEYVECPECQGTGGILKRRVHTKEIITVSRSTMLEAKIAKEK